MKRDIRVYIEDIIAAITKIEEYMQQVDYEKDEIIKIKQGL